MVDWTVDLMEELSEDLGEKLGGDPSGESSDDVFSEDTLDSAEFHEEHFRARELESMVLTPRPSLALPPFRYLMITKPQFKFPLPKSNFVYLSVACESAIIPGSLVNVGVRLSSHPHDSIFVSSIHLTIEAGGSVVLDVRPVFETKSGISKCQISRIPQARRI